MRRDCGAPRVHVHKYEACPELAVLQQIQGTVGYCVLVGQSNKLIQNHTLGGEERQSICLMNKITAVYSGPRAYTRPQGSCK